MAKVISDQLHKNLCKIIEELMDRTKGSAKSKVAGIFTELSEAQTPPGYEE